MEYRPAPSNKVKGSRIRWRRRLPFTGGLKLPWVKRKNRYFSIVFSQESGLGAAVFEVKPSIMRPYLAELDLRTGTRVEMESFEP